MFDLLKTLCGLNGISGRERAVAQFIKSELDKTGVKYEIDNLGNVIAEVKGKKTPDKKLMISAHMDEVGFICTDITDDGYLRIAPVGGIDPRVVPARQVTVNGAVGVIGTKAVHMQSAEERGKSIKFDDMLVDIGADSKEQAEKIADLGDDIYFKSEYCEYGDGQITAKALDDRIGCAVLLMLAKSEPEYDMTLLFCVQEEVGLRGSGAATQKINPDCAIVVEATTAADIPDVPAHKRVCALGGGAVVGFMDKSTIYDKQLYDLAFATAKEENIPCQTKTTIAGGNDAGAIHKSAGGVKTIAVSAPSRYIHSPSCTVKKCDVESVYRLVERLARKICES